MRKFPPTQCANLHAGKQQHVIEVFNFVDAGTSILLDAQVQADFHAQTVLEAVIRFLHRYGLPPRITFDRDPRFVGGATGRDFPSPLVRLLLCLGIQPQICPPHRPDKNAFVERYHRTFNQECLQLHRPHTLSQVREMTASFLIHYNTERPNQALSCGNRPPRVAFPTLKSLPPLPTLVDPDAWLQQIHGQHFMMPLPLGRPSAMLLSPSTFRREVRRCFSHFVAVTLFRVWTMEPHRRTSLRSATPSRAFLRTLVDQSVSRSFCP